MKRNMISLELTPYLSDRINKEAKDLGISRSAVIRMALMEWLSLQEHIAEMLSHPADPNQLTMWEEIDNGNP